jgi:hypothetical protein
LRLPWIDVAVGIIPLRLAVLRLNQETESRKTQTAIGPLKFA